MDSKPDGNLKPYHGYKLKSTAFGWLIYDKYEHLLGACDPDELTDRINEFEEEELA